MAYTQLPYMVKIEFEEADDPTEVATSSFHVAPGTDWAADMTGMGLGASLSSVTEAFADLSGMVVNDIRVQAYYVDDVKPNFEALPQTASTSTKGHFVFETGLLIPITVGLPCFDPALKQPNTDFISGGIKDSKMNIKIKNLIHYIGGFDASGAKDPAAVTIADSMGNGADRFLYADMVHSGKKGMRLGRKARG